MAKFLALLLMLGLASAQKPIKIVLVGDSTVNDEGGWGEGFRKCFDAPVEVVNLAKNGRSSKNFRDEGLWAPALAAKPDFILIQFGHNDEPGKGPDRETDPATTYRANMTRYIDEARAASATPILVTSIVRRNFDGGGKIKRDHLVDYVAEVRKLAAEKNVPLIDLYALTLVQAESLGPEGSKSLGATTKEGKLDTTHLSATGRQEIGAIAAGEFIRLEPALKPLFGKRPQKNCRLWWRAPPGLVRTRPNNNATNPNTVSNTVVGSGAS